MDPIELMSIKPLQIKQALGKDRVKVIRGSRLVYNSRQTRIRRGHEAEFEDDDDQKLQTVSIWTCTDVACGGVLQRRILPLMTRDNASQTDRMDMAYYWETEEELKLHNVTVVTGKARNIRPRTKRRPGRKDSNISIEHRGSLSSIGSQANLEGRKRTSKANKYFSMFKKAFRNFFVKESALASDDVTTTDEEIPQHEPEERDNEWLEDTEEEQSQDYMRAEFEQRMKTKLPRGIRTELQCHNLMSSITPFFWLMKLGGRWPLETYIEDRLVKFRLRRLSLNFFIFFLTSLYLLLCTSIGSVSIINFLSMNSTRPSYEALRESILFVKYWPYVFTTIFLAAYTTVWNLATIFDDGKFTGDFMTRWNMGVVAINYDPCEGFKWELCVSFGWLIFYLATITIFHIWDLIPTVRGTSELLGILLLSPFLTKNKIAEYYTAVQYFGIFFHLYAVYSARTITLFVILYCKFLENLARRWNLRFCYVCGMLGRFETPHKFITYHTSIPFKKLFVEHKLILAFSRHTSQIFSIALTAYFMEKFLEMLILSYRTCCLFMFEDEESYEINGTLKTLPCPPGYSFHCNPIKYRDEDVYLYMSLLYCMGQSIFGWYITTESISNCGQAIMSGYNFVRRYGFPRCKNSKERRFIQSLTFVFTPISDYFVSPGCLVINRKFIYEMFALVFVFTSMLVSFSPFQLGKEEITFCFAPIHDTVPCHTLVVPKFQSYKVLTENEVKDREVKAFLRRPTSEEVELPSRTTEVPTTTTTGKPPPPKYVNCPRGTDRPTTPGAPSIVTYPNGIAVPIGCSSRSTFYRPFQGGAGSCFNPRLPAHQMLSRPYDPAPPVMYYCGTNVMVKVNPPIGRDDCGNLPFSPDGLEPPKKAVQMWFLRAGPTTSSPAVVRPVVCCCYDYEFYREPQLNIRVEDNACAMNSINQATWFCSRQCRRSKTC